MISHEKSIAIMQPYFFPYIGYFQLIRTTDRFIIYDDVSYRKQGWINRNCILVNGEPRYITAPLQHSSPNKKICEIELMPSSIWREKLIKTIELSYRNAPYFYEVFPVVEIIIRNKTQNLSEYLVYQLEILAALMGIETKFVRTSRCYKNENLSGTARVVDICRIEGASKYVNSQGGQILYGKESFRKLGIDLRFAVMRPISYKQRSVVFVPRLSIIDVLMAVGFIGIRGHLMEFDLIP